MQNIFKSSVLVIVLITAAGVLFAQESPDIAKEFLQIYQKSFELRKDKPVRTLSTEERFDKSGKTLISKLISFNEWIPPDRNYYSRTIESGNEKSKLESIRVGDKFYARKDEGQWQIIKPEPAFAEAGGGVQTSFKLLEKTTFNNQNVNIYEVTGSESSSISGSRDYKRKYWFSEAGLLVKIESEETYEDKFVRRVTTNEYDVKIKIEAPLQ